MANFHDLRQLTQLIGKRIEGSDRDNVIADFELRDELEATHSETTDDATVPDRRNGSAASTDAPADSIYGTRPQYYRVENRYWQHVNLLGEFWVLEFGYRPAADALKKATDELEALKKRDYGIDFDVTSLNPWELDEDHEIIGVYGHYADEEQAIQDARRMLLAHAIGSDELRAGTGWDLDCVLLVYGMHWYTIRTHRSGIIDVRVNEDTLLASETYGTTVFELAEEFRDSRSLNITDVAAPIVAKVVEAWLRREAATAMLDQARLSLRVRMEGLDRIQQHPDIPEVNLSDLARKLHTDRPNLYRLLPSKAAPRRRRAT
ncbi:hypothetical protein [Catellatospora paridis]|uniref:hypothetical protein n=1 Tax=Catellatospora paridis TaxID=1617086 RepID=UPI0012D4B38A|nr:hypothetical protein [Catellatospora paridis]